MPKKSTEKPSFKSEAEEADWYHTPEGRRWCTRVMQRAARKGTVVVEEKITPQRALEIARVSGGKRVVLTQGMPLRRTDPAVLQKLWEDAIASMTKAVSLRIPLADLEAAKALAQKKGTGYQTVLKEIIHEGLRRAS